MKLSTAAALPDAAKITKKTNSLIFFLLVCRTNVRHLFQFNFNLVNSCFCFLFFVHYLRLFYLCVAALAGSVLILFAAFGRCAGFCEIFCMRVCVCVCLSASGDCHCV